MKLTFDADKSEWNLPEEALQQHLSTAIVRHEERQLATQASRKFWITGLSVTVAAIGGSVLMLTGQFLPILIGAVIFWHGYDLAKTYIEGKNR